jgi:hypothetical protein
LEAAYAILAWDFLDGSRNFVYCYCITVELELERNVMNGTDVRLVDGVIFITPTPRWCMRLSKWVCRKFHQDHWHNYYAPPNKALVCGYCALVISIDAPVGKSRERN